jgi:hypothetical protein
MECHGSILRSWDGSDPVFGLEKMEERNGSIFCSVWGIGEQNGIRLKLIFCLSIIIKSGKWPF